MGDVETDDVPADEDFYAEDRVGAKRRNEQPRSRYHLARPGPPTRKKGRAKEIIVNTRVIGVDGCRGGWCATVLENGQLHAIEFHASAHDVIKTHTDAKVFAFDIPIGLCQTGNRKADDEAREFLKGNASSVFRAPVHAVLNADNFQTANSLSKKECGKGMTPFSWGLVPKIREVARLVDSRVFEVHPEVCFRKMSGQRLERKKSAKGCFERLELLRQHDLHIPDHLHLPPEPATDDVLDSMAAAWTATRIAENKAESFPSPPESIGGREVAIWY